MSLTLAQTPTRSFLGHPVMLVPLFLSETWERFSFYGMRALLVLYMVKRLSINDNDALDVYGSYLALVYALPMLGGLMADRLLGHRNAVMIGQVLMALGHLTLAFDGGSSPGEGTRQLLFLGLSLVAVGNGFMKPNISTLVGRLYAKGDPRRDAGFSLFYMGVNLGATAGALACAWLQQEYDWSYGFGAAGIGMLFGLAFFASSRKHLPEDTLPQGRQARTPIWLLPILAALVALTWWLLQNHQIMSAVLVFATVSVLWYLAYSTLRADVGEAGQRSLFIALALAWTAVVFWFYADAVLSDLGMTTGNIGSVLGGAAALSALALVYLALGRARRSGNGQTERGHLMAALLLTLASVILWFISEQAGGSLNLLAERHIPRELLGMDVPAASYQSLNPAFIIVLAPLFGQIWLGLANRGRDLSTQVKFTLGMVLTAASMGMLLVPCALAGGATQISAWWLVLSYMVGAAGEVLISPIGLSAITRLAAPGMVSTMMGLWFLGTAGGDFLAQQVGKLVSIDPSVAGAASNIGDYVTLFAVLTAVGTITAALVFLLQPWLGRLIAEPKPVAT